MSACIWRVRGYYSNDVKPPKVPGTLAIEAIHKTDNGKDVEVSALESRRDIGRVAVACIEHKP